jgi:hypothetical protein
MNEAFEMIDRNIHDVVGSKNFREYNSDLLQS